MRFGIAVLMISLSLTACATAPSSPVAVAPDVQVYSENTRTKAIQEIEGGTCTTLVEIVKDCKVMRDQSRVLHPASKREGTNF